MSKTWDLHQFSFKTMSFRKITFKAHLESEPHGGGRKGCRPLKLSFTRKTRRFAFLKKRHFFPGTHDSCSWGFQKSTKYWETYNETQRVSNIRPLGTCELFSYCHCFLPLCPSNSPGLKTVPWPINVHWCVCAWYDFLKDAPMLFFFRKMHTVKCLLLFLGTDTDFMNFCIQHWREVNERIGKHHHLPLENTSPWCTY